MTMRLLGEADEPQGSGAVVAVHFGDYRLQEIWVRSGANIGNWYCLGGEFGTPKVAYDRRTEFQKMTSRETWRQPDGTIPLHPTWYDVLTRGPVTLLVPGDDDTYTAGWRAGRKAMHDEMESLIYDDPPAARRIG